MKANPFIASLPESEADLDFAYRLAFCLALQSAGRQEDGLKQMALVEAYARTPWQKSAFHYWRARMYQEMEEPALEQRDWKAFIALPEDVRPADWSALARKRLTLLTAPTPTLSPTVTRTAVPSSTPTITRTPRQSGTPAATPTRTVPVQSIPSQTRTPGQASPTPPP
jgi:hypothetical protein